MLQKFMLIAVIGYVLFASLAATLASTDNGITRGRRLVIIMLHWCGLLVFVVASFGQLLAVMTFPAWNDLWPVPTGLIAGVALAVTASIIYGRPELRGWWSPLPWIRGVATVTVVAALADAAQGARYAWLPDWRFVGTSLIIWLLSLIVADFALLFSRSAPSPDRSARVVRELLRLCAALPALLIYLIGIRL